MLHTSRYTTHLHSLESDSNKTDFPESEIHGNMIIGGVVSRALDCALS